MNLHYVNWRKIGYTDEFKDLKKSIKDVQDDIFYSGFIVELCIYDILKAFKDNGYKVVKE